MKIIIFRHGQKQDLPNSQNSQINLTKIGRSQILKLGNILKIRFPELIDSEIIYSSPIKRSIQSTKIIKKILGIKKIIFVSEFEEFFPVKDFSQPQEIRDHLISQAMIDHNFISPDVGISYNQVLSSFEKK